MALSTQASLEKWLQADFTNEPEPVVTQLLDYAEAVIESYCDRTFAVVAGASVTLDGRGDETLFLPQWPVTAVNSLTEDGDALVEDEDFFWYPDGRLLRGDPTSTFTLRWSRARKNVVVNYDHGYATIPKTLNLVSDELAGQMFKQSAAWANAPVNASGVRSIALSGSDTIQFADAVSDPNAGVEALTNLQTTLLSKYRRVTF